MMTQFEYIFPEYQLICRVAQLWAPPRSSSLDEAISDGGVGGSLGRPVELSQLVAGGVAIQKYTINQLFTWKLVAGGGFDLCIDHPLTLPAKRRVAEYFFELAQDDQPEAPDCAIR
jgi:hypothetical protein